jgi:hypothetical protein
MADCGRGPALEYIDKIRYRDRNMNSSSLLLTISQLAIALAGFSAIVVALNSKPVREWDDTDRLNLRCLLQVSIYVLAFSLFPFLLAVSLSEAAVWRYGLLIYGLFVTLDASFFLTKMTRESPVLFRNAGIGGVCIGILNIGVAAFGNQVARESMYLVALFWQLGIVLMSFLLLLYQVRKPN